MEKDKYSRQIEGDLEKGFGEIEFNRRDFLRITGAGIAWLISQGIVALVIAAGFVKKRFGLALSSKV